jgi:hypothetical protein
VDVLNEMDLWRDTVIIFTAVRHLPEELIGAN